MAATTRLTLRASVAAHVQGRTDLESAIDVALDSGCEELSRYSWRELTGRDASVATVANVQYVSLPSDIEEVLRVQLIDKVSYTSCELANTGDLLTITGPTVASASGTKVQFTAGSLPDATPALALNTSYFLRKAAGTSGAYTYTLYDTASHASTGGSSGLIAINEDADTLTVLLGNGTRSYNVPLWAKHEAERRYPAADVFPVGSPEGCYREGDRLYFVPCPDVAWTVRVAYRAALVLSTSEESPYGTMSAEGFNSLLVAYATAEVFEALEHGDRSAERWWRIFHRRVVRKRLSQASTGVEYKVDTRLLKEKKPPYRDPTVVRW